MDFELREQPNLQKTYINENLVSVEKTKAVLKLNKAIFLGMSLLDLSKIHMCKSADIAEG